MRRRLIAAAWIAGATLPLAVSVILAFGCCVLPFHHAIHEVMPACEVAGQLMAAGHDHHDEATPAAPAKERQEPARSLATTLAGATRLPAISASAEALEASMAASPRNVVAFGALRCDQDVGLVILGRSLLI